MAEEHECVAELVESTEVVQLDPAAVDNDEDVSCSVSDSSEVCFTVSSSGSSITSRVRKC